MNDGFVGDVDLVELWKIEVRDKSHAKYQARLMQEAREAEERRLKAIEDDKNLRTLLTGILAAAGLRVKIEGCGCCGSPQVKVEYQGQVIVDMDDFNFDMFKEEEKQGE